MSKKRKPYVLEKEDFGFKSELEITKLKTKRITVKVHLGNAPFKELLQFSPKERVKIQAAWFKEKFNQLIKQTIFNEVTEKNLGKSYASFNATLHARHLTKLLKEKSVWNLTLLEVEGIEKQIQIEDNTLHWYAVKGIYAIQIEGKTKGIQTFEERILLVKATSFEDAEKKAWKESKNYVEPYMNPYGEMVRWQLEKIEDVYWTYIEEFDPNGTEIFSTLKSRRMKPEYEWHPRRSED